MLVRQLLRTRRDAGRTAIRRLHVQPPGAGAGAVAPRARRASGNLSRPDADRGPRAAPIRGARVARVRHVQRARKRFCAVALRRLPQGAGSGVLLQGSRVLPELHRPAHGRHGGAAGGRHLSDRRSGSTVGAEPADRSYRLAYNGKLLSDVLAVFLQVVRGWYYKHANAAGHKDVRCGSVTFAKRFGSALNLNLHFVISPVWISR